VKNSILRYSALLITCLVLIFPVLVGCGPSVKDIEAVDYAPVLRDDWELSTPAAEGLDPLLVAEMYYEAAEHETIYSLLVVKNGRLVAEKYFNKGREDATRIMLHVHHKGVGICGVYTYEVAETKVTQVIDFARQHGHPLQCTMEKE